MSEKRFLSADEVSKSLGISKATLYAYVSRGYIRSESGTDGKKRTKRYRKEDVDALKARKTMRSDPAQASKVMLNWGMPVMESAITMIEASKLYYAGQDVEILATRNSLEEVASLLWLDSINNVLPELDIEDGLEADLFKELAPLAAVTNKQDIFSRYQILLAAASSNDFFAAELTQESIAKTGVKILQLAAWACSTHDSFVYQSDIAESLTNSWLERTSKDIQVKQFSIQHRDYRALVNAALILLAEHELNATTFAARCVASARATPYEVVAAGLACLNSQHYSGHMARIDALIEEAKTPDRLEEVLKARLRRGEELHGFGHRLYPSGDPRAHLLTKLLQAYASDTDGAGFAIAGLELGQKLLKRAPEISYVMVCMQRALQLPKEAPLVFFAVGRTVGWIAHSIEQYQKDQLIRPRATYVGELPKN